MACLIATRRWLVLLATVLGSLLAEPMTLVSGIYLIPWTDTFNCTIGDVSVIASVASVSYHLGSLSGIWTDRIGYRMVVVMGGALMSVGVLISAFVPSRIVMIFTFGFFSCFFAGTTFPAFNVALVSYFSKNFGSIRGISSAGTGLGIFAIPPLLQYLVTTYGWRGSLVVFSAIGSHLVVLGMLLRPKDSSFPTRRTRNISPRTAKLPTEDERPLSTESPLTEDGSQEVANIRHREEFEIMDDVETGAGSRNDDLLPCDSGEVVQVISLGMKNAKSPSGGEGALGSSLKGLLSILRYSYRMYLLILTSVFLGVAYNGVTNHLPTSLVYRGVEPQAASLLMSFFGIGSIVGRAISGFLVDHHLVRSATLLGVAIFALGGTMILFRVVATYWLYAVASFFFGATSGITFNLVVVFARECVGKTHMGRAITLNMLSSGLGSLFGPIMMGWLYDETQSYNCPFFTMGGILLFAGLMFAGEPTLRRKESAKANAILQKIKDDEMQSAL